MAYGQYRPVVIDHLKVPNTDQTNFTVLIKGTYPDLKTVGNGGKVTSSSGYDIEFFSDTGLSTKLKCERVAWDGATGAVVFWVKVPTVATAADTTIYMAYGNASVTTDQQDAANAFDANYKFVIHGGDGSTPSAVDSKGLHNGTLTGSPAAAAGVINGAISVQGGTKYIAMGDADDFSQPSGFTIEGWVKKTGDGVSDVIFSKYDVHYEYDLGWYNTDALIFTVADDSGPTFIGRKKADGSGLSGVWHHFAATYSGGTGPSACKIFIDGVQADDTDYLNTGSVTLRNTSQVLDIGGDDAGLGDGLDGLIEEMRFSAAVRSADWLKTQYNNQSAPSSFYSVGSEVGVGGSSSAVLRNLL